MNTFWKDFVIYFFGTTDFALVSVNFIYGCVGMFIMMLIDVMGRDKKANYSPDGFSIKYFWKDNGLRFVLNFFIMLVCIRFSADFVKEPPSPRTSLLIGFLSDVIVLMVKKRKQKFKEDNENGDKIVITDQTTNTQTIESSSTQQPTA